MASCASLPVTVTGSLRTCTEFPFHPCGHSHREIFKWKHYTAIRPHRQCAQGFLSKTPKPSRFTAGTTRLAVIAALSGRIYNPPLQTYPLPFSIVGAHCICARAAPPGSTGPQSWRHVGMPPYEVRRGCGRNRGPVRADIQSAPTGAPAAVSSRRGGDRKSTRLNSSH